MKYIERSSLFRQIINLLGVNGVSYLLMFLISIVIFRTVDKSHYGLYVIIVSLFAVIDLLLAGLNDSIVRFLNDKISLNKKQNIVLIILCYRYFLIFMFVAAIYLARISGFFEFLIDNYSDVAGILDSFIIVILLILL